MNGIMKKITKLLGRELTAPQVASIIEETIKSNGWKIIEDHIKTSIESSYKSLLNCKADEVNKIQTEITLAIELIKNIYAMAGLKWEYDGYSKINGLFEDEANNSAYEEVYEEYMEKKLEEKTNG